MKTLKTILFITNFYSCSLQQTLKRKVLFKHCNKRFILHQKWPSTMDVFVLHGAIFSSLMFTQFNKTSHTPTSYTYEVTQTTVFLASTRMFFTTNLTISYIHIEEYFTDFRRPMFARKVLTRLLLSISDKWHSNLLWYHRKK